MSNKCEYCTFNKVGFGKAWYDNNALFKTYILHTTGDTYFLVTESGDYTANINHCPKCGRELREDF